MNLKVLAAVALVFSGLGFLTGYQVAKGPKQGPINVNLPPKVITVNQVKVIPGPTEYRIIERIKFQTKSVEVPVERLKEVTTFIDPIGRVRLEANKFEGLKNGKLAFGWKGNAVCEFAPKNQPTAWLKLVESPFDLTESKAEATSPPLIPLSRKTRLDLSLGAGQTGLLTQIGLSRRVTHRGFLGRALAPDWYGTSLGYSSVGEVQVLISVGKEF